MNYKKKTASKRTHNRHKGMGNSKKIDTWSRHIHKSFLRWLYDTHELNH